MGDPSCATLFLVMLVVPDQVHCILLNYPLCQRQCLVAAAAAADRRGLERAAVGSYRLLL